MRPPVTMQLEEMIMDGNWLALIFFDSSEVCANVSPGQVTGDPYFLIRSAACGVYSSECFRKMSTALMAMGLSQNTGTCGTCPDSISSFSMKTNFFVRSTANAGTTALPA